MTYPAFGILHISFITGNQVNVNMKNTLSGHFPDINADVETIWMKPVLQDHLASVYQLP